MVKSGIAKQHNKQHVQNNINGLKNIKLIHAKEKPPDLKLILTNSLFTNKTAGIFKAQTADGAVVQATFT